MSNIAISIVIPAYNAEKYIECMLHSIRNQTFENYEVIIVNDGSTDNTRNICEYFCSIDTRFKLINQENSGVSIARKIGMLRITGEYFISLDSDDWIEADMLENLYNTAINEGSDIVFCDYDKIYENHTEVVNNQLNSTEIIDYLKAQLGGGMWGIYWNKLIKTDIIKENKIYPIDNISMWEDYIVTNLCAINARKISYCRKVLYHYNQTNCNSLTKKYCEKNFTDILLVIELLSKAIESSKYKESLHDEIVRMKVYAKDYMIHSNFQDFEKWLETFPEVNIISICLTNDFYERQIRKNIINKNYMLAKIFLLFQKIERKIDRLIKKFI